MRTDGGQSGQSGGQSATKQGISALGIFAWDISTTSPAGGGRGKGEHEMSKPETFNHDGWKVATTVTLIDAKVFIETAYPNYEASLFEWKYAGYRRLDDLNLERDSIDYIAAREDGNTLRLVLSCRSGYGEHDVFWVQMTYHGNFLVLWAEVDAAAPTQILDAVRVVDEAQKERDREVARASIEKLKETQ